MLVFQALEVLHQCAAPLLHRRDVLVLINAELSITGGSASTIHIVEASSTKAVPPIFHEGDLSRASLASDVTPNANPLDQCYIPTQPCPSPSTKSPPPPNSPPSSTANAPPTLTPSIPSSGSFGTISPPPASPSCATANAAHGKTIPRADGSRLWIRRLVMR